MSGRDSDSRHPVHWRASVSGNDDNEYGSTLLESNRNHTDDIKWVCGHQRGVNDQILKDALDVRPD